MNKKTAIGMAAALSLTLILGAMAAALNFTGISEAQTSKTAEMQKEKKPKPIVKTRTIRRHKDVGPGANGGSAGPWMSSGSSAGSAEVVRVQSSGGSGGSGSSGGGDDSYENEHEGGDDHGDDGGEDHEDSEDHDEHEDEGDDD